MAETKCLPAIVSCSLCLMGIGMWQVEQASLQVRRQVCHDMQT